jgi:hypothetical protein
MAAGSGTEHVRQVRKKSSQVLRTNLARANFADEKTPLRRQGWAKYPLKLQ